MVYGRIAYNTLLYLVYNRETCFYGSPRDKGAALKAIF